MADPAAQAAQVARALAAAQEAREVAREAREVAKEAREVFIHQATKINDVLYPQTLVMAIVYPTVIAFTLGARVWDYAWSVADDGCSGPNQWVTFMRTMSSFVGYTLVHVFAVARMRIEGPPDAPKLARPYSCWAPIIIFLVGCTYFFTYASLSRYGGHISEWIAMGSFSGILLMFTLFVIGAPLSTSDIIEPPAAGPKSGEQAA